MLHDTVMFTLATGGYVPFVLNLHASLDRLGLGTHLVAYTLDDESHRVLSGAGLACRRVATVSCGHWHDWRTAGFKQVMYAKYAVALDIFASGRNVLFVDSDIVFLKHPVEYLQAVVSRPSTHLVMQCQAPQNTLNAGFWWAAPAAPVIDLFSQVAAALQADERWDCDQRLLNLRAPNVPGLDVQTLDPALFACGNQFLTGKRRQPFDMAAAFLLHFNFIIGMESKVAAMQEHGALFDPDLAKHGPSFRRTVVRRAARLRTTLHGQPIRRWPGLLWRLAARA